MRRSAWDLSGDTVMDWRVGAACRESLDPDAWLVSTTNLTAANREALRVCTTCPVRAQCLAWYESLPREMRLSVIAGGIRFNDAGHPERSWTPPFVPDGPPTGVLSTAQAAAYLRVRPHTVKQWCVSGKLAATRDGHGHWRIRAEDLPEVADA